MENKALFFKCINLLTENFLSGKEIDLQQLQLFANTGKIETTINYSTNDFFKRIESTEEKVARQTICITETAREVKGVKLGAILQKEFENILVTDRNKKFFLDFISKKLIPSIPKRTSPVSGKPINKMPLIFVQGQNELGELRLFQYRRGMRRSDPVDLHIYHIYRTNYYLPPYVNEGVFIITGKKK